MKTCLAALSLAFALPAAAQAPDVTKLYQVTTDGSTTKLGTGQKGKLVLSIKLDPAAHVSDEAPLKIALTGTDGAVPEKATLAYPDQVSKKPADQKYANPVVFEVPFAVDVPADAKADPKSKSVSAAVKAKMTFFVCTEQICSRQQKEVSLPVQVCRGSASSC
ncbi:MAG TPA: protein-disulfide reductase DsbD domain-containing protein [Myxococcaceae bacterium]|jgi:hypothetical protein